MHLQEETAACGLGDWPACFVTTAEFDVSWNSRFGAMLNLVRSTFVIVALGCGAVLFNNDSNRLVLRPIERMLRKVWTLLALSVRSSVCLCVCRVHITLLSALWLADCT